MKRWARGVLSRALAAHLGPPQADPRVLTQPRRGLLQHRRAQGARPERVALARRTQGRAPFIRRAVQPDRRPFEWRLTRLDLHRVLGATSPVARAAEPYRCGMASASTRRAPPPNARGSPGHWSSSRVRRSSPRRTWEVRWAAIRASLPWTRPAGPSARYRLSRRPTWRTGWPSTRVVSGAVWPQVRT